MSCKALVVKANFGSDLPLAGNFPLTETGFPPKVTVAPEFFTAGFVDFFLLDFFADFFFALVFFAGLAFFFVATNISLLSVVF